MKPFDLTGCGPIGRTWIARDHACTSPSYAREYALVIDHAQGSQVWDTDGRRYIDLMAGVAVMNVGHRHPHVVAKVQETIEKFWHICLSDFYYPQAIELAEKLQKIAPMQEKTRLYFSNSGTEAVEAAIKLAMHHTGRREFIGFRKAFHGRTLGSLSFTASKYVQRARYPKAVQVHHVPFPDQYRPQLHLREGQDYGQAICDYIEQVLFETTVSAQEVAAILVEPIQGEGGYVIPTAGFFGRLRQLCTQHGILLIADEIQSGAGRTGKMWAIEHEQVEPDILCFAKGIGSGMPIGGIISRESVTTWGTGAHGSTYGGNPIACSSALATIEVIEQEGLLERATELGEYLLGRFQELQTRHPTLGDVRGRGLMLGMEFVRNRETKEPFPELRNTLNQIGFELGVLLLPCGKSSMRLTPALNIGRDLLEEGMNLFAQALTQAEKAHPYMPTLHSVP